jgi:hypothetical protein
VHYHIANMMIHIIAYNRQCLITNMIIHQSRKFLSPSRNFECASVTFPSVTSVARLAVRVVGGGGGDPAEIKEGVILSPSPSANGPAAGRGHRLLGP